jgi:hypothetical protein
MLAFTLDNLIFLLLIAVAGLFQLLSKTLSKAGKSDWNETSTSPKPQPPRPVQRTPRESDADRVRKFLEALGQPASSTPPPPIVPRADVSPRPLAPVQPPPVVIPRAWRLPRERQQKPDPFEKQSRLPEQPGGLQHAVPPPVPVSATPAFEIHELLPADTQQSPTVTIPVETYASPKPSGLSGGADFKTDIAALLASKSTLREVILLREILGTPRGLQHLDLIGN